MTNLHLADIGAALVTTFTFPDVVTQGHSDLTESIATTPTLQVYFQHVDDNQPGTNRGSFGTTPIRTRPIQFNVDCLAAVRRDIGADMEQVYDLADLVMDKLDAETEAPFFGLEGIKQYSWSADRVIFEYGKQKLTGIRIVLTLWIY